MHMLRKMHRTGAGRFPLLTSQVRTVLSKPPQQPPKVNVPRVLITGALGQIGAELIHVLRKKYGRDNIIASDVKLPARDMYEDGPYVYVDVTDYHTLAKVAVDFGVDWIVHNSSVISGVGEANPKLALDVNLNGIRNVLELAKNLNLRVFSPSTIAVFSEESGQDMTKDDVILKPTTVYGITKVFLEQLGCYYTRRYNVDFRCCRYPGIISSGALPGGGTTDYAVHIYYNAAKNPPEKFICPIKEDESLPMMYMPDCIKATTTLLEAPQELLKRRVYNVSSLAFTPKQLYECVKKRVPELEIEYRPTNLQDIARTWPNSMDDSEARKDWGWQPEWNMDRMTDDMLEALREKKL